MKKKVKKKIVKKAAKSVSKKSVIKKKTKVKARKGSVKIATKKKKIVAKKIRSRAQKKAAAVELVNETIAPIEVAKESEGVKEENLAPLTPSEDCAIPESTASDEPANAMPCEKNPIIDALEAPKVIITPVDQFDLSSTDRASLVASRMQSFVNFSFVAVGVVSVLGLLLHLVAQTINQGF